MDEQMRRDFEAWATHPEREMDIRREDLQPAPYIDYTTAWAWSAWQGALSQPAAQVDSSHSAGGECGGVQALIAADEDKVPDRPWIPVNGRIPDGLVDSDLVDLKFADGIIFANEEVAGWQWDSHQGKAAIVAYRMAVL